MGIDIFLIYLIIINIIGFSFFYVSIYKHKKQIDKLIIIISLLGGSLGGLIAFLLFDRKLEKDNMMSSIFIICIFVIQLIIFLLIKVPIEDNITFRFWDFLSKHKVLLVYLSITNLISFLTFALDKLFAMKNKSRIRVSTLIWLCFIGGSVGGLTSMYLFNHKTKKDYFTVGVPLIMVVQIVVIFYLANVL